MDGQSLSQLSSFPRSRPLTCPAWPVQYGFLEYTYNVDNSIKHFYLIKQLFTIVWNKKVCSFLQDKGWLVLKHFVQVPMTVDTMNCTPILQLWEVLWGNRSKYKKWWYVAAKAFGHLQGLFICKILIIYKQMTSSERDCLLF